MHLADDYCAHKLVVAVTEKCAAGSERYFGRQGVALQCACERDRVDGFLLIGNAGECVNGDVAKPIARACRPVCPTSDRFVECRDLWQVRLIPPPFHRPPADFGRVGHAEDTFKLEQRATNRHILHSPEPHDLLQAVRLILTTHQVDEHVWSIRPSVQQWP
jgi:hypothetical protein